MIDFATMIIVKDLFKDDKKIISYYFFTVDQYHTVKNCVTDKKEILASLTSSRPWRQVVSTNSWHQDVLNVKMSSSSRKSHQDVLSIKMSHMLQNAPSNCCLT